MSTEKITQKIIEKAQAEAKAIEEEAKKEAERIIEEAKKKAKERLDKAKVEAEEAKKREIEKLVGLQKIELRKELLAARRGFIDSAFEKALEKFKEDDDAYRKLMEKVVSSINFHGDETVFYSDDVVRDVLKKHTKSLKVKLEKAEDIDHGFVVRRGEVEMNFTLSDIMREASRELEAEVARILFEK